MARSHSVRSGRGKTLLSLALLSICGNAASAAIISSGASGGPRRVSYWVSRLTTPDNATALINEIKANGGLNIASNFFLYCEDKILPNGTFVPGIVSPGCDAFTAQAKALGMGSERVIGGDIGGLRILFSNSTAAAAVIAQMAALVKLKTLTGLSWDVEPTGTTYKDALAFGRFNQQLSAAIAGSGARVSVYSNAYSSIIADIADYASSVGAVLTGETYNGKDYPSWLANYESVAACFNKSCGPEAVAPTRSTVEAKRPSATLPPKMVPAMLASTERGTWNCDPAGMKQRVDRILTDGATELALFVLAPPNPSQSTRDNRPVAPPSISCITTWFPYAAAFINGTTAGL